MMLGFEDTVLVIGALGIGMRVWGWGLGLGSFEGLC